MISGFDSIACSKQTLRRFFLEKRRESDYLSRKREAEVEIYRNLFLLPEFKNASKLLLFASTKFEISTDTIFSRFISDEKSVYFPKTFGNGKMDFFKTVELTSLSVGNFSVREPKETEKYEIKDINISERRKIGNDVCIVPALSFDRNGYRIGYGGGYYDRFLALFGGVKIGLCLNDFISDKIPSDVFDIRVDIIVTEKGVIRVE